MSENQIKEKELNGMENPFIKKCVEEYLKITCPKVIFIYTSPKVGSTALVSSFRIFTSKKINIFHFHNESLLPQEYKNAGVTINNLIHYCASVLGKKIYVIDVYRTPIEKKISTFFDRLAVYHYNAPENVVETYSIKHITNRFNSLFPYLGDCDYWFDKHYGDAVADSLPPVFPHDSKYITVDCNLVKYIKLRLSDSKNWGSILSTIFGLHIEVIGDYARENKPLGKLYTQFKKEYKIPHAFLNDICKHDRHFQYYMSANERSAYINKWHAKSTETPVCVYTKEEYGFYSQLCAENSYMDFVQKNSEHYLDSGCVCDGCMAKRTRVAALIVANPDNPNIGNIHHSHHKIDGIGNQSYKNRMYKIVRRRQRGKSRSRSATIRMTLLS